MAADQAPEQAPPERIKPFGKQLPDGDVENSPPHSPP